MALLMAFIGYQLYRITVQISFGLIALTIFDALLVWLTWREYRAKRARLHEPTHALSGGPASGPLSPRS
jgi:uncharacterized membrane protein